MADSGKFRLDLFHRIAGTTVRVPALTERREDIPLLARAFLRQWSLNGAEAIEPAVAELLVRAEWPGNVRQLKHVVELSCTLSDDGHVSMTSVRAALQMDSSHEPRRMQYNQTDRRLLQVLESVNWNVPAAAKQLGVHRSTIYRRAARLNVTLRGRLADL